LEDRAQISEARRVAERPVEPVAEPAEII